MWKLGLGLLAALAAAGIGKADTPNSSTAPGWFGPKAGALRAAWPRDANGRLIYGQVILDCSSDAKGHAADCTVKSSSPANPLLEKAAPNLAANFTTRDKRIARQPLKFSVTTDTDPDWLKKPTIDELLAVFPTKADGRAGKATIVCILKTDGLLRACKVAEESPPGYGFGEAALLLTPSFLMKPAMRDGQPVEDEVSIPVNFGESNAGGSGPPIRVVTTPAWDKTPTVSEILAELNKKVGDKFADGKVVFQCTVTKRTGRLSDCVVINSAASMAGFTGAARALTSKFEVNKEALAKVKEEVRVNLAFSFPDMQSDTWSKRYLVHPVWLNTVSPDPNQPLFPEEAAKAGLKTGKATVDCVLAPGGALTQCEVVSESTPGMGFGALAVRIAQVFVANPWTEDGLPADGAHVRMPIRMDYTPPAEGAPPAEPPTPATKP